MPQIDAYIFGMISIDGHQYTSDVRIFPDRVKPDWWRERGHVLNMDDIRDVVSEAPEVIIIGTGASGALAVPSGIEREVRAAGIELIVLHTREAIDKHNELTGSRHVVTCLHLTC